MLMINAERISDASQLFKYTAVQMFVVIMIVSFEEADTIIQQKVH